MSCLVGTKGDDIELYKTVLTNVMLLRQEKLTFGSSDVWLYASRSFIMLKCTCKQSVHKHPYIDNKILCVLSMHM